MVLRRTTLCSEFPPGKLSLFWVKKKWRLWSVIFPLFASETRLSFLRSRVLTKKKKKKTRTRRSLSRARFNELLSLLRSQSARIRVDLFFPRAKKRRKARVDLREREVSLSLLCAKHRTKLSVPANLLLFRRKKSFQYWCPPKKAESLVALPSRRARTKKTRLEDAGRRDVPFFTRTKSLSRGRDSFRAACVCALFCDVSRLFVRFPPG